MDCEGGCKPLAPPAKQLMPASPSSTRLDVAAIVVAAGKGLRAGQPVPKQFANWRGKPVVRHAVEAILQAGAFRVLVAIPDGAQELAAAALAGLEPVAFVVGGETRQQSVRNALEALAPSNPDLVLIHDAARPDCPAEVVENLLEKLQSHAGAIPALPVVDSLARAEDGYMAAAARREELRRVQTPQGFRFAAILEAHRAWQGAPDAGDDAQVAMAAGVKVALADGHERLRKLTFAEDFMDQVPVFPRVGAGYDVHRLARGEEMWLCGVQIPHDFGLSGHSDADVALHALVDAILGAIGAGDIGQHFPPSDAQWKGAPSARFVEHAMRLASEAGYVIGNADITIICEAPKIGPYRETMRNCVAGMLSAPVNAVNIKATTTEKLGFTGRGEGIAAQAAVTLVPLERN